MKFLVPTNKFKQVAKLVTKLTTSQIKSRYRKTLAGFFWVLLNPVLSFLVQALIFKHILKIQMDNFYLFLLAGVVPWIFITSTLGMTVSSFVSQRSTLLAFKISPWILILGQALDNFVNFFIAYIFLIFLVDHSTFLNFAIIPFFILSTLMLILFTFFLSFTLAIINVLFRDTQFILGFILNLAYFVTPIFYPVSLIPEQYQIFIKLNPFFIFIRPFQHLIWKYDNALYMSSSTTALLTLIGLIIINQLLWRRNKDALYLKI